MKKKIEELIQTEDYQGAWEAIAAYEKIQPGDAEIDNYKFLCAALGDGDFRAAHWYAKRAVKAMPYSADAHGNYAFACQLCGKLQEAYEQYCITVKLAEAGNPCQLDMKQLEQDMMKLTEQIKNDYQRTEEGPEKEEKRKWLEYFNLKGDLGWEVGTKIFHSTYPIVGADYMDYKELPKMYVAYGDMEGKKWQESYSDERCTYYIKAELQRATEWTNRLAIECATDSFLPIVMKEKGNLLLDINDEKHIMMPDSWTEQYVNYRMPAGKVEIHSEQPFRAGTMVPIEHNPKRKRLVLNLFLDGLSQTVLQEDFERLMPNTYRFFKKGMICTNAHTAADWTFPSIASVVTGQTEARHKMLHSKITRKLDFDLPILFEYFKAAGYNTSKIGGNWRITPDFGYGRGIDRFRYANAYVQYMAENVIADAMDQIHFMRETDQFIWMEITDLHTIADDEDTGRFIGELPLWERKRETDDVNSVKQEYNEIKIQYYRNQIEKVDRKLVSLFHYIEEHYTDDEILISLFADHGQGYLLKPEERFLADGRSNVAFMVRGNGICGQTDEIISTCDYAPIMCALAGIPFSFANTDAHLPKAFGGSGEREFAIMESIHVGDPYQIALKGKDFTFYMNGEKEVTTECRVPHGEYTAVLVDRDGKEIADEEKIKYYMEYCKEHIAPCTIFD